jgi:hypothetical protein
LPASFTSLQIILSPRGKYALGDGVKIPWLSDVAKELPRVKRRRSLAKRKKSGDYSQDVLGKKRFRRSWVNKRR